MKDKIQTDLQSASAVHQAMMADKSLHIQLAELAEWCLDALLKGGKILFAGNGGSFADSQHLAAEFISRLQFDRAPLPAIALATNSSSTSAIGNDYGYDQVFTRELRALAGSHDVFIPISTSGNSPNILTAVAVAQELSIRTMGFAGEGGGQLASICPCVRVPSSRTERIQEGHILLGHILCGLLENAYFKGHQSRLKEEV
ncbi:MAG TPA: D-sedoheptulose-7-phosphate isomerase [Candidatus Brocadiaceae bacterium]|nr:SIS domain-containing protein [Candidatus Woesearchaeota archaeon]